MNRDLDTGPAIPTEHDPTTRSESKGPDVPPAPGPIPAKRRHRALEIIGVVALGLFGLGVVGAITEQGEGEIFSENFDSDEVGFSTDSDRFVDLSVVDGVYQVTIRDAQQPQGMRHVLDRTYDGLSFSSTVVHPADGRTGAAAAVGCWAGRSAYMFILWSHGDVAIVDTIDESTGDRVFLTESIPVGAARTPGRPNRLRIDCVGGGSRPTVVSGYVNGDPVVSVEIPNGYDSFDAIGFWIASDLDGARFTADDVSVHARRPAPATSPVPPLENLAAGIARNAGSCESVLKFTDEAFTAGRDTEARDIVALGAPEWCSSLAEVEEAWKAVFAERLPRGVEEFIARSCAATGPAGVSIRDADLCRDALSRHPEAG